MAEIISFPIRSAKDHGVYCPPLDVHFPALYRAVQTVTPEQLVAEGLRGMEPVHGYVHYTLNPDQKYTGTITQMHVKCIVEPAGWSLIIRHHRSLELAGVYLDAVDDIDPDYTLGPILQTEVGFFTLARRSTPQHWEGPRLIHRADLRGGEPPSWSFILGRDGQEKPEDPEP